MTRTIRRRPPILPPEQPQPSSSHSELVDEGEFLSWSNIDSVGQLHLMQQWMQNSWSSLSEFCVVKGVQYHSIREAFIRRGLPTVGSARVDKYEQMLKDVADRTINTLSNTQSNMLLIQQLICRKLLSSQMTTVELLKAGAILSEHMRGSAVSLDSLTNAMSRLGIGSDEPPIIEAQGRVVVPGDLQREFDQVLANQAEQLVRQRQGVD